MIISLQTVETGTVYTKVTALFIDVLDCAAYKQWNKIKHLSPEDDKTISQIKHLTSLDEELTDDESINDNESTNNDTSTDDESTGDLSTYNERTDDELIDGEWSENNINNEYVVKINLILKENPN